MGQLLFTWMQNQCVRNGNASEAMVCKLNQRSNLSREEHQAKKGEQHLWRFTEGRVTSIPGDLQRGWAADACTEGTNKSQIGSLVLKQKWDVGRKLRLGSFRLNAQDSSLIDSSSSQIGWLRAAVLECHSSSCRLPDSEYWKKGPNSWIVNRWFSKYWVKKLPN